MSEIQMTKTKTAVMQPYLFPYIGYFQLIEAVDKFILFDDVAFINRGWVNRNRVLSNGKALMFTVPVRRVSSSMLIKDTETVEYQKWKEKFLKTLHHCYAKAPYFEDAMALIRGILEPGGPFIGALASHSIKAICRWAGIETSITGSTVVYGNAHLKGQDRILDICVREGTGQYINTIHGETLYSKGVFDAKGIRLNFLKPGDIVYPQFKNEFVPHLSIIDVLMFNSRERVGELLKDYELVEPASEAVV